MEKFEVGTISSKGIGIGKICTIMAYEKVDLYIIKKEDTLSEKERFLIARKQVIVQLENLVEYAKSELGDVHIDLFEAHLELFIDDEFEESIIEKIENKLYCAEYAVEEFIDETCEEFMELDDYFKERIADIKDIGRRLIVTLQGQEYNSYAGIEDNTVIVAHDLTPSMTAQLDTSKIVGFLTETGGVTSHVSFIAQSLGIPAIVGASNILSHCKNGNDIILDALDSAIIINPDEKTKTMYEIKRNEYMKLLNKLLSNVNEKAITQDGVEITLLANIGGVNDIDSVLKYGGDGVGLFRTEFLFMNGVPPSEEMQFDIYKKVLQTLKDKKDVTIRTLDIGGDKEIPFLSLPHEDNPFLGYRAVRIYEEHIEIIKPQLRAILRASKYGNLNIMIPMIISIKEVLWIQKFIKDIENELIKEGHKVEKYSVGIMVETPSVAVMADVFIKEVDFFSIGTNDLVQYTLAVDRGNDKISCLYQPFHPALIRLLQQIITVCKKNEKSVSVCGDMGGDEYAVLLLMGLGLEKISMTPSKIPIIKHLIKNINIEELKKEVTQILDYHTVEDIRIKLEKIYNKLNL